jgi:hypothetical protein
VDAGNRVPARTRETPRAAVRANRDGRMTRVYDDVTALLCMGNGGQVPVGDALYRLERTSTGLKPIFSFDPPFSFFCLPDTEMLYVAEPGVVMRTFFFGCQ